MGRITGLRLTVVVLLVGVAMAAAGRVVTYSGPQPKPAGHAPPGSYYGQVSIPPDWTTPLVGLVGILALGAAVLVFQRRR